MNDNRTTSIDDAFCRFRDLGDVGALDRVFGQAAPELFSLVRHLVRDVHDAEDILQATFLSAIDSAQSFESGARVLPWMVGILTNHVHNHRRKAKRLPKDAGDAIEAAVGDQAEPSATADAREMQSTLERAIEALAQPYREVVEMTVHGGLLAKEIAEKLTRPAGTVRSQVTRGMDMLRKALPAGAAPSMFALETGRGLDAIRDEVLSHAASQTQHAVASTATATAAPAKTGVVLTIGAIVCLAASAVISLTTDWFTTPADSANGTAPVTVASEDVETNRDEASTGDEDERRVVVARPAAFETATAPTEAAGRCVNENGDPIPGVALFALSQSNARSAPSKDRIAISDADGEFAMPPSLPSGMQGVVFESPDFVHRFVETRGGARDHEFGDVTLRRGLTVHGRIVDARTEQPLRGEHEVRLVRTSGDDEVGVAKMTFDPNSGAFYSEVRLAPGSYDAFVSNTKGTVSIELPEANDSHSLEIRVETFGEVEPIRGVVVDTNGLAIAEARVFEQPSHASYGMASTRTDANGRFAITRGNPALESVRLMAIARGYTASQPIEAGWGDDGVKFVLEREQQIELRVEDFDTGTPIERFHVDILFPSLDVAASFGSRREQELEFHEGGIHQIVRHPTPRRAAILASEDYLPALVDLGDDATVVVRLEKRVACGVVVRTRDGEPLPSTRVAVLQVIGNADPRTERDRAWFDAAARPTAVSSVAKAMTNAEGLATVMASTHSDYALSVHTEGSAVLIVPNVRLSADESTIVTIDTRASVSGRLVGEKFFRRHGNMKTHTNGSYVIHERGSDWTIGASVVWTPAHVDKVHWRSEYPTAIVAQDGTFSLAVTPDQPGKLWLRQHYATAQMSTTAPSRVLQTIAPVTVGGHATVEIDVDAFALAGLSVEVPTLDPRGDDVTFRLESDIPGMGSAMHIVEGKALLILPPDAPVQRLFLQQYRTERRADGSSSSWSIGGIEAPVNVTLRPGELQEIAIDPAHAAVTVELRDDNGKPIANRTVYVYHGTERNHARSVWLRTDANGRGHTDYFTPGATMLFTDGKHGQDVDLGTVQLTAGADNTFRFTVSK